MITKAQFHTARTPLKKRTAPQAEPSRPGGLAMLWVEQVDGAPGLAASDLVDLPRMVETAATVSIDGDAAVGASVRLRQP